MKLIIAMLALSLFSGISTASDIELVSTFLISVDGEIKNAPDGHVCNGLYKVDRAMSVPNQNKGFIDWNDTVGTPDYGKTFRVYELQNKRSWLFSIKYHNEESKEAVVGFGLFCIKSLTEE